MDRSEDAESVISRDAVRHALRAWASLQELGAHPLSSLACVRERQQAEHYSETPAGRGLALQMVLRAAIEALRPEPEPVNWLEKRWRPYIILTEQYLFGRGPDWIADTLHVSRRTYYAEQEQGLNAVADVLWSWEEECRRQLALSSRSAAPASSGAPPSSDTPQSSIPYLAPPRPAHMLIGREELLHTLRGRLLERTSPLVALHGLPGVGKTALVVELAHHNEVLAHFRGGILWAGVGREPDVLALLGSWAAALGVPAEEIARYPDPVARAQLVHATIGLRQMLLVIDDAWRIDIALMFKVGGPNCAHILTTRMPGVALDFAGNGVALATELDLADGLELLTQIAPMVREGDAQRASALVQATGGLPLALILIGRHLRQQSHGRQRRRLRDTLDELHAAQTRLRLAHPQSPLEAHPALPPGAPISLQAIIGLSTGALGLAERRALRDLALFPPKPNTFSEQAALTTAACSGQLLDVLVDAGLLECSGDERYTLHQTIADYAQERSTDPQTIQRMVEYCVRFAEDHSANYDQLAVERDNLLASLHYAYTGELRDAFVRGVHAMAAFLMLHGLYGQLAPWLDAALEWLADDDAERRYDLLWRRDYVRTTLGNHHSRAPDLDALHTLAELLNDDSKRMEVLLRRASYDFWSCNYSAVIAGSQRVLEIAQALGSVRGEIEGRLALGRALVRQSGYHDACAHYAQALELAQAANLQRLAADALRAWGVAASDHADYARARSCHEQSFEIYKILGDQRGRGYALMNLAIVALHQLDYQRAQHYFQQSLQLNREMGHQRNVTATLLNLGKLARLQGKLAQAHANYGEALQLSREIQLRDYEANALNELGVMALAYGAHDQAIALIKQALEIYRAIGNRQEEHRAALTLGQALYRSGADDAAYETLQQALEILRELEDQIGEADGLLYLGDVLSRAARWTEAAAAYQRAVDVHRTLKQLDLAIDPLAGLIRVALERGQLARTLVWTEEIMTRMQINPRLALTADPLLAYQTCYRALQANGDRRAEQVRQEGRELLQRWAAHISDPEQLAGFTSVAMARYSLLVDD